MHIRENSWVCNISPYLSTDSSHNSFSPIMFVPPEAGHLSERYLVLNTWPLLLPSFILSSQCMLCLEHMHLHPTPWAKIVGYFASYVCCHFQRPLWLILWSKEAKWIIWRALWPFYNPPSFQTHFQRPYFIACYSAARTVWPTHGLLGKLV